MIQSYAALERHATLQPHAYEPAPLQALDVEIKVSHCGICRSDIHLIDNDWNSSKYPLIPGHEIIGSVQARGDLVQHLNIGDRVGIGWQCSACYQCEWCLQGKENLCAKHLATCVTRPGGYAESIRVDSRFAFKIPETLDSAQTAPLLCGGVTVYSPFRQYQVQSGQKVGILGIGGLGHLALQFAKAWGCEVTAFSGSSDKEGEAQSFGAHHFVDTSDKDWTQKAKSSQDFILSTVSAELNWQSYFDCLRPRGKLVIVGASPGMIRIPPHALIGGERSLGGSLIGGRNTIREMLEFAALHRVQAQIEILPMAEVNQAIEKVRQNQARYRMVLANG